MKENQIINLYNFTFMYNRLLIYNRYIYFLLLLCTVDYYRFIREKINIKTLLHSIPFPFHIHTIFLPQIAIPCFIILILFSFNEFSIIMGLTKSKVKSPAASYDPAIQKRIQQFYAIKNCADELAKQIVLLADQFNVYEDDGKKNHNVALGLCVRLGLHGTNTKEMNTQFELFLIGMSQAYDEIAREQAILQKELRDKVIGPLKSWTQVEFPRMDAEIQKLHSCTYQYNQAKNAIHKKNYNQTQLQFELARRELQLQMDSVKIELSKLRLIKENHNKLLRELIKTLASYHERVAKILDAKRTDV